MESSEVKQCSRCKEERPVSLFQKHSYRNSLQSWCKLCKNKFAKEHYKKNKEKRDKQMVYRIRLNKQKAIEYLGGKCLDCNGVFHPSVYDFHHRNPEEKEIGPQKLMHRSWNKITKEIDKCDLLCSNCHRIRHNGSNY